MLTLLALSDGPDILLDNAVVMVGRLSKCDARLESLRVSRRHCLIIAAGGDVVVRDLGSTNGTWVNGRRVTTRRIRPGDEVSIAHIRYQLGEATTLRAAANDLPSRLESA
jgi:pSer/pThr/pTyr-binding forkhead associated (FHA) protein